MSWSFSPCDPSQKTTFAGVVIRWISSTHFWIAAF